MTTVTRERALAILREHGVWHPEDLWLFDRDLGIAADYPLWRVLRWLGY